MGWQEDSEGYEARTAGMERMKLLKMIAKCECVYPM